MTARRRMTQAERTALSDHRMFNSAIDLILERGANRATLREICENAGYSRGLANTRFGSKDNFLRELLKYFNHVWTDHLEARTAQRRGLDAVIAAMDALAVFMVEQNRYMRGGYIIWYEHIVGANPIRAQLARNHARYRADVAQWLEQGIEDGTVRPDVRVIEFATFYVSWVSGTIYQWLVAPEAIDLPAMFDHIKRIAKQELSPTGGTQ